MLTLKPLTRKDINKTMHYYADGADDYYTGKGDASVWFGKGAASLNLQGEVTKEAMHPLLLGHIPGQKACSRKSTRHDQKDRIAYDLTFSAPKSVSLQALIGRDPRIIACHQHAINSALTAAESFAQARLKVKKKSYTETTGNLIVAQFRHETSRAGDPQLHTHAVVMNMTQRKDGQWRVLKNDEIIKRVKFLGHIYRQELAQALIKEGYKLRYGKDNFFELDHFTDQQLQAFSQRSQQVEAILDQKGLTRQIASTAVKQQATLQSRVRKTHEQRDVLLNKWKIQAKALGINMILEKTTSSKNKEDMPDKVLLFDRAFEEVQRNLHYAIHHLTERKAVISDKELIKAAFTHGLGQSKVEDIKKTLPFLVEKEKLIVRDVLYGSTKDTSEEPRTEKAWIEELIARGIDRDFAAKRVKEGIKKERLVIAETRYTTPKAVTFEKAILTSECRGRQAFLPLLDEDTARTLLNQTSLKEEQKLASHMILTTTHRVMGVQGFAGVGKSYLLKTCCDIVGAQGHDIEVIAPYNNQVKELKKLDVTARTVANFLRNATGPSVNQKVLIVDEAGLVPTRTMKKVLAYTEKQNIRLILLGDIMQMPAIEAGKPFAQLQEAGMKMISLKDIQRQKTSDLKTAVQHAAYGETEASLKHINTLVEIKGSSKRYTKMAQDYVNVVSKTKEEAILLTGTNDSRASLNHLVRKELDLVDKGIWVTSLRQIDLTSAQKAFVRYYSVGDVIKPEKAYKRSPLIKGMYYRIVDKEENNQLILKDRAGKCIHFNPVRHRELSIYEKERIELTKKDKVRVQFRDLKQGVEKGDCFEVESITDKHLILKDEKRKITLPVKQYLPLIHAYASTVHSSQGMTLDHVFVNIETGCLTTNKNLYYVAISRARLDANVYTNNIKALPKAINQETLKESALKIKKELYKDKHHTFSSKEKDHLSK